MPIRLVSFVLVQSSACILFNVPTSIHSCAVRYKTWVTNPKLAQEMAENVTRKSIGVRCCPVAGIPQPKEEEEELLEMTREIDLS